MERLTDISALADGAKKPERIKKKEFTFEELVDAAKANDCFNHMMEGNTKKDEQGEEYTVLNQRSKSALGKMFSAKYGGRKFRLKDGRVVRFGHRGRNRHRRYNVEIEG
jgi:hypothetical protein